MQFFASFKQLMPTGFMRIMLKNIILFFILIHCLAATAQTKASASVLKYYSIGSNSSIISTGMLLSFLKDTSNKIYDFDFTTWQVNVFDKTERLKIMYGVPFNEVLIHWEAGKDYSDQNYLNRYFYHHENVYRKVSSDPAFTLNPADSTTANRFLYQPLALQNRMMDMDRPLQISILYYYPAGTSTPAPYLINFFKPIAAAGRAAGSDFNFNIKWGDFIAHLTKLYSARVIYYNPLYKALNEKYAYMHDASVWREVCYLPCELVYGKNNIDSVRFYKELAEPDAFYVKRYELYKTFPYDSLHAYFLSTYKVKDFVLPLPEIWKQHQQLFIADSTKTLPFDLVGESKTWSSKKKKTRIPASVFYSENINIVCLNNECLFSGAQTFQSILLEYIQNHTLTLYAAPENYYHLPDTLVPAPIDTREIYYLYEHGLQYDACYYKDSLYRLNEHLRVRCLRDTCFDMDPVQVLEYTDAYLASGIMADTAADPNAFDVKRYFEKDSSFQFDWQKYITQISLLSTMRVEDLTKIKKYAPEYVSIDLSYLNDKGIMISLGLVKWADLKVLMLKDQRAWYTAGKQKRNYIQDIEQAQVLRLFEYLNNEIE